jgi:hypothetical protein
LSFYGFGLVSALAIAALNFRKAIALQLTVVVESISTRR